MKKKLFTLLTLLLCLCSGAWATDAEWSMANWPTSTTDDPSYPSFNGLSFISTSSGTPKTPTYAAPSTSSESSDIEFSDGSKYKKYYGSGGASNFRANSDGSWNSLAKVFSFEAEKGDIIKVYFRGNNNSESYIYISYAASTTDKDANTAFASASSTNKAATILEGEATKDGRVYIWMNQNMKIYAITVESGNSCTAVAAPTDLSCTAHTKNSLTFGWTAAENASKYTATLYSNSECTGDPVATTSDISSTSVTFSGLSGSTTYYCKVQSNGDGSTYCAEGGITSAATGTTDGKDYTVSAQSNNNEWGSAAAEAGSLDEGEKTNVTATANDGYKFVSWAVEGEGASLSSTTANPTELTMGTANATVTATFRALETYAITYNKGANGTGTIAAGEKTEDEDFTLSSEKFAREGFVQTGWATTDGGEKVYDLGGSYTANAGIELFPVWTVLVYTVTYNANCGTCSTESDVQPSYGASLTLPTPTFSGCTFDGWYNNGTKVGDAGASYTPTANITLYAKWTDNTTGKLFSYIDGNYGDKFQAFDASGWVTGDETNKSKTFTDATTGAQFVITNGGWDKKDNSISSLAKFISGTTTMKVVVPTGYKATVKIWYNSYSTSKYLKIDGTNQTAPTTILANDNTNAQVEANLVEVEVTDKTGDVVLTSQSTSSGNNIYIARVAVELTEASANVQSYGWATYIPTSNVEFADGDAYVVTDINTSTGATTVAPVTQVPANTPVLLKGEGTKNIAIINTTPAAPSKNLMEVYDGSDKGTKVPYVLAKNGESAGFKKWTGAASVITGRAVMWLDSAIATAREFFSLDDVTTGINALDNELLTIDNNAPMYNLAGQKVGKNYKGIVIVNGKKVLKK